MTQPFVFAEVGPLSSSGTGPVDDDTLRDSFLPVTSSARSSAATSGFPLTGFKQIRDQTVTSTKGVHGVRETFNYTFPDGIVDTFDEIALTNHDQSQVYLLVVHCSTSCFSSNQSQINDVMSSFTVRSP